MEVSSTGLCMTCLERAVASAIETLETLHNSKEARDKFCRELDLQDERSASHWTVHKQREKTIHESALGTVTLQTTFSSRYVEVRQKTPGILPAVSRDAWAGYVSPSGGYINYGTFQVRGVNPDTRRKNKRVYQVASEADAIKCAENDGLVEPFEITALPSEPPSERQLTYAESLGAILPPNACRVDVSAIISRITDGDEAPLHEQIARQAHIYGLQYSLYFGEKRMKELAQYALSASDYEEFVKSTKEYYYWH